ncbi:unnamed protein product [marine sediment metagenome]|uniref:Uncharacterized protein n=1 Tax=marine sediment metagenome TaxID=412755 RepID=X0TR08_9ZZZZ
MASKVARTALITDAQPLIPHAQGISWFACFARLVRAIGNGIPIKKANGAISRMVSKILMLMGKAMSNEKSDCNVKI